MAERYMEGPTTYLELKAKVVTHIGAAPVDIASAPRKRSDTPQELNRKRGPETRTHQDVRTTECSARVTNGPRAWVMDSCTKHCHVCFSCGGGHPAARVLFSSCARSRRNGLRQSRIWTEERCVCATATLGLRVVRLAPLCGCREVQCRRGPPRVYPKRPCQGQDRRQSSNWSWIQSPQHLRQGARSRTSKWHDCHEHRAGRRCPASVGERRKMLDP